MPASGNAFWSQRAQEELVLRMNRPRDLPEMLPVPGDDDETSRELEEVVERESSRREGRSSSPGQRAGTRGRRSRSRVGGDPLSGRMAFRTPASWADRGAVQGQWQTAGEMPVEGVRGQAEGERRTQPMRSEGVVFPDGRHEDGLQREVEKEMVKMLQDENERLRHQMTELMKKMEARSGKSEWSEVTVESPGPRKEDQVRMERPRYTPNGTKVPEGPPPLECGRQLPPVPPWPFPEWEIYEKDEGGRGKRMELESMEWELHRGIPGGGMKSRHEVPQGGTSSRHAVPDGGIESRHGRDQGAKGVGHGASSRQGEAHPMRTSEVSPAQAREFWLQQEMERLQREMEGHRLQSGRRWDGYWKNPVHRYGDVHPGSDQIKEDMRLGRAQGDRAEHLHRADLRGGRAEHLHQEERRGDRVLHPHHAGSEGDRAWQPHHDGAGRDHAQGGVGGSTAATGVGGTQDQGGNHRTVELPELSGGDLTPLILGDWLEVVKPLMMDLSPQASRWWVLVVEESYKYYNEWRKATPMERLRIVPESEVVKTDLTLHRTEQRGISLLLKAIPTSVKETVIAERLMTTTGILFTLLKNFQPGGSSERTMLLKELSEIKVGKSPGEACAGVRSWRRFYTRTKEIDATVPDPIILLKALEPAVQLVSQLDAQATFRLAQSRAQLQVDARPEESSVWNYSECLLAELESLRLVHGTSATANNGTSSTTTPAVKMLGTRSTTTPACKFWGSDTGCRQGKRCSYLHDWASLEDRNNRCFLCSSTAHRKADCPTRPTGDSTAPVGGSGSGGGGGGTQKGKGIGKNKSSKGKSGGEERSGNGSSKGKGEGQQSQQQQSQQAGLQEASLKAMSGAAAPSSTESVAGSTTSKPESLSTEKELMGEVASLLKSLRVAEGSANPQLSAIRLARVLRSDKSVLIDGGATHCLRNPHSREEYLNHAEEVRVDLAAGAVRMRQDTGTGTLYSEDPDIQPIVPLADVIKIGVVVKWDSSGCEMRLRSGEKLPVYLQDGCPMLPYLRGMELLYEVEEFNRRKIKLRMAVVNPQPDRDQEEAFMSRLARLFPEVPLRLLERVLGKFKVDNDIMGFNRRIRRQVERAETVVLNLFSGPSTKVWTSHGQRGLLFLNIEILKGQDLHETNLFGYLETQARFGRFAMITAGPPCKTVSFCRFGHMEDGGPPPLRAREGPLRFGLEGISPAQQEEADGDSVLWIKTLWLIHLARESRGDLCFMVEQPRDPQEWRENEVRLHQGFGYPSFLCWPETDRVLSDGDHIRLDQGSLGHKRKKPTTLITNIPEIKMLNGLQDHTVQRPWPATLQERMAESRALAEWAPELKRLLVSVALRIHRGQPPLRLRPTNPRLNALSSQDKKELEMWQAHINQEHLPMRRDCHDCLLAMGRDRPRRRQVCPASYCLSIDVAGPFEPGIDQVSGNPRYFMIGCYTLPVSQGLALTEAIEKLGGKVKTKPLQIEEELGKECSIPGEDKQEHFLAELDQVDEFLAGLEQEMEVPQDDPDRFISDSELVAPRLASENVPHQGDPLLQADQSVEGEDVFQERKERRRKGQEDSLPEVVIKELDLQNANWKHKIAELKEVEVVNLTMAVPLRSRHAPEVLRAVSTLYVRLRGLGLPIYRLHSDRAREFTGKVMRDWILSHDMEHTTTAADESAGNGRVESEIAHLKHHTKLLLTTAKAQASYWPMALRHASEFRFRKTLEQLGVPVPRLIPFGSDAIAKSKFWHRTMKGFPTPMQKVKVWGPAVGMSISSRGYWIEADGKWMRSTVVVQPGVHPPLAPELPLEDTHEDLGETVSVSPTEEQVDLVAPNQVDEDGLPVIQLQHPEQDDAIEWVPKRRFMMKKPLIPGSADAQLRMRMLCSNRGGCWSEVPNSWCGGSSPTTSLPDTPRKESTAINKAWATLEHLHLRKLEVEERQLIRGEAGEASLTVLSQAEEQCKEIENFIQENQHDKTGEEVMVNQPVSLEEVRRNLSDWKEALKSEYESLKNFGAIRPVGPDELAKLHEEFEVVEKLPTMLVAVKKPPMRLKARVVACGNHAEAATGSTTAGGVDTVVVRTLVSEAANRDLAILTSDVKTAFLQAPRRNTPGRVTILSPPMILREARCLDSADEKWVVERAMYGLTESPKDWGDFRNSKMKEMRWMSNGQEKWIRASPEPHLWEVCQDDATGQNKDPVILSHIAVYVDDLMVTGERDTALEVMEELAKVFSMTKPEEVTREKEVTFCGYQIKKTKAGYALHQTKYIEEVLKKHDIKKAENIPCHKVLDEPDEQEPSREDIRLAQVLTGELGWVTSRTRPDIAYAVSIMARMIHRRPKWVKETGIQVLKYLYGSASWGLNYTKIEEPEVLNVLVDASYAPPHEGYRSVQGAIYTHGNNILMWSSSRQGFITQSTAEAELLAYNESAQGAESIAHLLACFGHKVARRLIGDSKSGLVQLTGEVGSWRTRHLRLRSAKLRELIQNGTDGWHAVHREGKDLASDGLTKPLLGQAFARFRELIFMKDCEEANVSEDVGDQDVNPSGGQGGLSMREVGCGLVGAGAALLTSGNRKLAVALVASGVALCWKGGTRPASKAIEQRPHKSPSKEGGKGLNKEGKGGAAHLKEVSRAGTTKEVGKEMKDEDVVRLGRAPGLRAMRRRGTGSQSSHGGADDGGKDGDKSPFPAGKKLFDDQSGLVTSSGRNPEHDRGAGSEQDQEQLREQVRKLEKRMQLLEIEKEGGSKASSSQEATRVVDDEGMQRALVPSDRPYKRKDGTVEDPPWKETRTTSVEAGGSMSLEEQAEERAGGQGLHRVICGTPSVPWTSPTTRTEENEVNEPWKLAQYHFCPTGQDRWDERMLESGWLVRVHVKGRKRLFHPLHGSLPVRHQDLQGQRVTKRFIRNEAQEVLVVRDDWRDDRRTPDNVVWSGYTFLRLTKGSGVEQEVPSDGSYERVDP